MKLILEVTWLKPQVEASCSVSKGTAICISQRRCSPRLLRPPARPCTASTCVHENTWWTGSGNCLNIHYDRKKNKKKLTPQIQSISVPQLTHTPMEKGWPRTRTGREREVPMGDAVAQSQILHSFSSSLFLRAPMQQTGASRAAPTCNNPGQVLAQDQLPMLQLSMLRCHAGLSTNTSCCRHFASSLTSVNILGGDCPVLMLLLFCFCA